MLSGRSPENALLESSGTQRGKTYQRVRESVQRKLGAIQRVLEAVQRLLGTIQRLLGSVPTAAGNRPTAAGSRPTLAGKRPTLVGKRSTCVGKRPALVGKRSNAAQNGPEGLKNAVIGGFGDLNGVAGAFFEPPVAWLLRFFAIQAKSRPPTSLREVGTPSNPGGYRRNTTELLSP